MTANLMRNALIVGINDYSWAPLKGCIYDANNMAKSLTHHHDGSKNFHVKKITSDTSHISKAQLFKEIKALFERPAEIALFAFSGHGVDRNLGGYLVTQDAQKHAPGISLNEIVEMANMATGIKEIIIVIDTCFSGHTGNTNPLIQDIASIRKGVTVFASSMQNENSWERNGQGIFSSVFVEALNGGGADIMGSVTVAGIYNYVDKALGPWEQRPVFKSHVTNLFALKKLKPEIPFEELRLLDDYFPDPHYHYPLNPEYEDTEQPRNTELESIFKFLQKCSRKNLVEPVNEEFMYYAAMNSESCRLTTLGRLYWKMVRKNKI